MLMKLDDIELIKRVEKDGAVEEIRSIHNLSISGKRRIVELQIPGSDSNVFQDLGREPLRISFDGRLVGPAAENTLQELKSKFELHEPVPFSTDITTISDVAEVVIEDFAIDFISGVPLGSRYSMVLKEHKPTGGPGETEPPSQEKRAKEDVKRKIGKIFESVKPSSG